jgi:hypothetical protein
MYLTLYPLKSLVNWKNIIKRSVEELGYMWHHRGCVWMHSDIKSIKNNIGYTDGFDLKLIRLAEKNHALAIKPHRYFFEDGQELPSNKPVYELFTSGGIPAPKPEYINIESVFNFHKTLAENNSLISDKPLEISESYSGLTTFTKRIIGNNGKDIALNTSLGKSLINTGASRIPENFEILICSFVPDSEKLLILYSNYLHNACDRLNITCNIKIKYPEEIITLLNKDLDVLQNSVILLAVKGKKGKEIMKVESDYLAKLDQFRVPYRLFSLDNRQLKWSSFDQIGILLESAGGSIYSIIMSEHHIKFPLVYIGIDLGHPRMKKKSWVVVTAVGETGKLIVYWRKDQIRDETLRTESITSALNWIYLQLRKRYGSDYRAVILRDGRMFDNENLETYRVYFRNDFTYIEVIKNPVPLMIAENRCAPEGSLCIPHESDYFFLVTSRSIIQEQIGLPLKIRILHDGLNLGRDSIAKQIVGLCYAPTLGLRPTRLPAPLYWANGLAAISENNHQFAGLHHVVHN